MEMERFNGKAKADEQGAVALVSDLAKAFERVSFLLGLGLGDALQFSQGRSCGCCAVFSSTRGVYSSKDVKQSHSQPVVCFFVLNCRMR